MGTWGINQCGSILLLKDEQFQTPSSHKFILNEPNPSSACILPTTVAFSVSSLVGCFSVQMNLILNLWVSWHFSTFLLLISDRRFQDVQSVRSKSAALLALFPSNIRVSLIDFIITLERFAFQRHPNRKQQTIPRFEWSAILWGYF